MAMPTTSRMTTTTLSPPRTPIPKTPELTVFADLLAHNYKLDIELRSDLHSFLDVARALPPLQLKVALIQQATALSNQQTLLETQSLCSTIHEVATKIYKSLSDNARITKEQMSEITAACKVVFYTGRRFEFSNEDFKAEVVPYLEKHTDANGLSMIFEDKTRAHHKLLIAKVGLAASNTKTWLRRTLVNSLPAVEKNNQGISVTELATSLSRKCLGDAKHVRPKHAIWVVIIRYFIRQHAELRFVVSSDNNDTNDDELEFPIGISTVPAKRNHTGAVVSQNSDGKRIEHFWRQITQLWKARNKMYGSSDLQCDGWSNFIGDCVKEELVLFPSDRLSLVVGDKSAAAAALTGAASSPVGGRLSGALREGAAGSRRPLASSNAGNTDTPSLPGKSGARSLPSGLDQLMATPTPFTFGSSTTSTNPRMFTFSNMASSSGITLPPLNSLGGGSSRH
ncbi:hypothetical protein K438DRAFT_2010409 [Mycena galopus ATCC 62051]|nr:hypothetical protein K438DRAFT_1945385 [Mycena galopus ATCC 62051]KAF8212130.1 hypothetical protein K438DRAFT_2010409 [Mycena galopus ATCC 62051]